MRIRKRSLTAHLLRPDSLDTQHALRLIREGRYRSLDGRSGNKTFRVETAGAAFSVKIVLGLKATEDRMVSLRLLDLLLAPEFEWYPRLHEISLLEGSEPMLVALRPFVSGSAFDASNAHISGLFGVLQDLNRLSVSSERIDSTHDYSTPWVRDCEWEISRSSAAIRSSHPELDHKMRAHSGEIVASALHLSSDTRVIPYHGDLHGGNLIYSKNDLVAVIDWDDAGFTNRPADIAKALWLVCRVQRGDFRLEPAKVKDFFRWVRKGSVLSCSAELARLPHLGAAYFLPSMDHITHLQTHAPEYRNWYLDWISLFWSQFEENSDLIRGLLMEYDPGK